MPATETVELSLQKAAATRLRQARRALDRSQDELYAAVRAAHEQGLSLRAIAGDAGLTHPGVAKILKRPADAEVTSAP